MNSPFLLSQTYLVFWYRCFRCTEKAKMWLSHWQVQEALHYGELTASTSPFSVGVFSMSASKTSSLSFRTYSKTGRAKEMWSVVVLPTHTDIHTCTISRNWDQSYKGRKKQQTHLQAIKSQQASCGLERAFDLLCVSLARVTLHLTYCSLQLGMLPKPQDPHQLPRVCRRSEQNFGVGGMFACVE